MPVMKSTDIVSAYKGNNPISKILLGDTLVWPREPLLEFDCVGTGQLLDMTVTNTTGYVGVVVDDTQLQIFSKTSETQYTVLQAQGSGYNKNYPIASSYKVNCKLALFKKRVIKIQKQNSDNQRYVADTSVGSIKAVLENPFATNFNVSISLTGKGTQTHSIVQNQSKSISFTGLSSGTYTITITDNDTGAVATKALSVGIGNRWSVSKYAIDFGEYTSTSTIPSKIQVYPLTKSEALALAFGNGCIIRAHAREGKTINGYRTTQFYNRIEFVLYTGGSGYPPNERIPVSNSNFGMQEWDPNKSNSDVAADAAGDLPYPMLDLITDETGTVVDLKKSQNINVHPVSTSINTTGYYHYVPADRRFDSLAEVLGQVSSGGDYKYDGTANAYFSNVTNYEQSYEDYIINGSNSDYNPTPFNTCFGFVNNAVSFGYRVVINGQWVSVSSVSKLDAFRTNIERWKANAFFSSGPAATANSPRVVFIAGDTSNNNILGGSDGLISENTLASAQGLTGKTTSISIGSIPVQRIKAQSQQELVAIQSDSYGTYDNLRSDRPDTVTISGSKKIQALHSSYVSYNYLRVIGNSARFAFWIKHTDTDTNTRTFEITKVELLAEDQDLTFSGGTYTASGYSPGTFTNGVNSYLRSVSHELEVDIPNTLDHFSHGVYTSSGGSNGAVYNQSIEVRRKAKINMSFPSNSDRPNVSLIDGGDYEFAATGPNYDDLIGNWSSSQGFGDFINTTLGHKFPIFSDESNYFYIFNQGSIFPTAIADPPLG